MIRYARMAGRKALWLPGTDHAGIATQTVVEKTLARERGVGRHELGRDAFVSEVFKWVDDYGGRICNQIRRMGASVDWSRQAFTMDAPRSVSVRFFLCVWGGRGVCVGGREGQGLFFLFTGAKGL